jgi:soluble lytic murein transglycosylase-like protein
MGVSAKEMMISKKALLIPGILACMEACFMPALGGDARMAAPRPSDGRAPYVLDVLRRSRTGLSSVEEAHLAEVILRESAAYEMDPLLVLALMKTESEFYNWSKSLKGAVGLMQILPSTGRALARELSLDWDGEGTLFNPYINVKMGIHYLSALNGRYNDTATTLAAYNAGPTGAAYMARRGDPPARFAARVLGNYRDMKEGAEERLDG